MIKIGLRGGTTRLILEKALRLNVDATSKIGQGKANAMLSTDVERIDHGYLIFVNVVRAVAYTSFAFM